jgi:GT2 family glycosyltransferase
MISFCIPIYPYSQKIVSITNECLERIHLFTEGEFEICIAINGCPKEELTESIDLSLVDKVVQFDDTIGNPRGWNESYKLATGDIICFMDNDVLCDTSWDVNIVNALNQKTLGIATPFLWWYKEGARTELIDDNCQGCCMWLRRETLDTLGYAFDERFSPAYAEDTDLFLRNNLLGFNRERINGSRAFHHRGATCYTVFEEYGGIEEVAKVSRKKYEEKWQHLDNCWELWQ